MTVQVARPRKKSNGLSEISSILNIANKVRGLSSGSGVSEDPSGAPPSAAPTAPQSSGPTLNTSPGSTQNPQFKETLLRRQQALNNPAGDLQRGAESLQFLSPEVRSRVEPILAQALQRAQPIRSA